MALHRCEGNEKTQTLAGQPYLSDLSQGNMSTGHLTVCHQTPLPIAGFLP